MLGIYTRISKDRPNQLSTKEQKLQGIELAKKLSLPYKLYEEKRGTSGGKRLGQRPKLDELVADIESGLITAIYIYNQDRAERDERTWFTLVDIILDNQVKLYENGIHQDLDDEDTRMLSGFKAIMNANFRRKTGKKIRDVLRRKVAEGKSINPVMTYGYTKDKDGYIIIDEEEIKIVKRIFEMSLSGMGSQRIADALNKEGIKTRYAKTAKGTITTKNPVSGITTTKKKSDVKWSGRTVLQIIKSNWYYGERTVKGETYQVPAIITKQYHQKLQDNLKKNVKHTGKKTHKYLLRGILKCQCGCNMYGVNNNAKQENYYKCASRRIKAKSCGTKSINRPKLDDFIWKRFFKDYHLFELVQKHFKNVNEESMLNKLKSDLSNLNTNLKTRSKQKDTTISLIVKDIISTQEGEQELKRIRSEINDLEIQIQQTQQQIQTYQNIIQSSEDITEQLKHYRTKTSFNDKKKIIHKYIKSITSSYIDKHYFLDIDFNIPNIETEHYVIESRFKYAIEPIKEILIATHRELNTYETDRHFVRNMSWVFREKYLPKRINSIN